MGVWIETDKNRKLLNDFMSHPAWVCGLKLTYTQQAGLMILSHPAWVCGLKHTLSNVILLDEESHPAWVCGLKHYEELYKT